MHTDEHTRLASERTLENVEYRDPKLGMKIPRLTIMRRMRLSINALGTS
jgi:hypothetical protein